MYFIANMMFPFLCGGVMDVPDAFKAVELLLGGFEIVRENRIDSLANRVHHVDFVARPVAASRIGVRIEVGNRLLVSGEVSALNVAENYSRLLPAVTFKHFELLSSFFPTKTV
jgi:hypothetical protein